MASDWQNQRLLADVDASAYVTPADVLIVVNEINRTGSRSLQNSPRLVDDPYCDVNGDGFLSPIDALLVINAINRHREPMSLIGCISPESDPNGNGVVLGSNLKIAGMSLPKVSIDVDVSGVAIRSLRTFADEEGTFEIQFPIEVGTHAVRVSALDEIGRTLEMQIDVHRGDLIQDWNAAILKVVRDWTTTSNDPYDNRIVTAQPPMVARNLAMIHSAMFDAINAVEGGFESYVYPGSQQPNVSPVAAAASAAHRVASVLYHDADELAIWNASLAESLSIVTDPIARDAGIALGRSIADMILAERANDGAFSTVSYIPQGLPGTWNRTFPDYIPPLLPQWPDVIPFAIPSGDTFRPAPPPALSSDEYAHAVDEVMRLGRLNSSERTGDQTEIALFWADGGGTATPPGHWNRIATDVITQQNLPLIESARTMALLNIALADAGIAAWDAKYVYDFWRPIDAIRQADSDSNDQTVADATWLPLLKTPPFPTYTSGHSTLSGAAATVLTLLFGDNYAFTSTTDGHSGYAQRPLDVSLIKTRSFTSFQQAAEEAGLSRIYGGIHFNFDNEAGLTSGKAIGEFVAAGMLGPVFE